MNETDSTTSGRRVVGWVFLGALVLGIGFGAFVGLVVPNDTASVGILFFDFRPTLLNMAAYGGGAVLLLSGIFYGAIRLTKRYDGDAKSV